MSEILGDAMMQTRTDLARGAEPGDSKQWLRSLKPSPETGKCACGVETSRRWATAAEQIAGRNWGFPYVWLCDACLDKRTIAQLQRSLYTSPYAKDLDPALRAGFAEMLKELEQKAA